MPYPLTFGQDARDDIIVSWSYFENEKHDLGDVFLNDIDDLFLRISDRPLLFPKFMIKNAKLFQNNLNSIFSSLLMGRMCTFWQLCMAAGIRADGKRDR